MTVKVQLTSFWQTLEATAAAAWHKAEAEGLQLVQELTPVVEDGVATLLKSFGALAADTILKFMQAEYAQLTGAEKHGNVVTTVFQAAEAEGQQVLMVDVTTLVKNLFLALTGTAPG